ncbi:3-oxoacyl-ACP reductase FabG [Alteribacter aurantiacus]|uniref:3-oxoacyl-ACP reductase FabG n=1 Tax=Alteribacter aurantiacus TaxID=254410 RepID=UPI00047E42D0|nr:3-oxoacyl-ACP reductase FabG [Alteribacter aurantiacus]
MERLNGKVALVTGGCRGIGQAIVRRFLSEGARVCVADYEKVDQAFSDALEGPVVFQADVRNREQIKLVCEQIVTKYGRIDILVNNAGIIRDKMLYKMSTSDWDDVLDVHLKGAFNCSQVVQQYMVQEGYGRIINLSSTSALGNRGQANYATAKAGIQGFTKTLALELGKYGITANAIAPGFIETDMTKQTAKRLGIDFETLVEASKAQIPVGRTGKGEDIANAAVFFAEESSSFVNGQVLYVAGGPKS